MLDIVAHEVLFELLYTKAVSKAVTGGAHRRAHGGIKLVSVCHQSCFRSATAYRHKN
jgi:hypothetical protein